MNKFRIEVDADLLQALFHCIDENTLPDHFLYPDQQKRLSDLMDEVAIARAYSDLLVISRNPLFESDAFAVYEHPEEGDEVPLMVYSKAMGELFVETPFHDCDDPQEIQDWLNGKVAMR